MMPAIKKCFDLLGDDTVEFSTENESLKIKKGCYDEKWHEKLKAKLIKQMDNEKRSNLIVSTRKKND